MFCAHCGKALEPGAAFCGSCGKKTEAHVPPKKVYETENKVGESVSPIRFRGDLAGMVKKPAEEEKTTTVLQREIPPASPRVHRPADFSGAPRAKTYPTIQKEQVADVAVKIVLWLSLFILYAAISALFVFAVQYGEGIKITSDFDSDVCKYLSFSEVLRYMYNGCTGFSPTVASVILSVLVYMLMYSLPVISLIMFIGILKGNSKIMWHTAFSVLNFLSAVILMIVMPLALRLIPDIAKVLAEEVSIMAVDVGTISGIPLIIFGAVNIILVIVSYVLLFCLLRRIKDENESA